jgi:hypothetical protein
MSTTKTSQPTQEPEPSIGRIVHYKRNSGSECIAAIITKVYKEGQIKITAFDPESATPLNLRVSKKESFSQDPLDGFWHWPERI